MINSGEGEIEEIVHEVAEIDSEHFFQETFVQGHLLGLVQNHIRVILFKNLSHELQIAHSAFKRVLFCFEIHSVLIEIVVERERI